MASKTRSSLRLVNRVLDLIMDWQSIDRTLAKEFLQDQYLSSDSERTIDEIVDHFSLIWLAVCREVADRTGISTDWFEIVVQPSVCDSSVSVVLLKPSALARREDPIVLLYDSYADWKFYWHSQEEMEHFLESVANRWIQKLQKAGVTADNVGVGA